jgi:hypothetical protein
MQAINNTPAGKLGFAFAQAIANGQFASAHAMLSQGLKQVLRPQDLESSYRHMIEYGEGPPSLIQVINVESMDGWPSKQERDLGWAYVAICGEEYSEAVSVVVAQESGREVIRKIEWGRP